MCDPVRWRRRLLVRNLAVLLLLPRWWKLAGSAGKENGESVEQREMQHSGGGGDQAKCRRKFRFTSAAVLCIWCYSVPEFSFLALRHVCRRPTIVVHHTATVRHCEEIRQGRLKTRDLVLNYSGILDLILLCNEAVEIVARTPTSLQLSVSDVLARVNQWWI